MKNLIKRISSYYQLIIFSIGVLRLLVIEFWILGQSALEFKDFDDSHQYQYRNCIYDLYKLQVIINSNMYYQTGSMRDIHNDSSPVKNSVIYDRENQFEYAQRSKYEKSQASYIQHQKHKPLYSQQKTNRMLKPQQNKQICYYVPIKIKSVEREDYIAKFKIQLLTLIQKNNNCTTIHITNDSDSLFLWSFFIRQSQYLNLKNQQSLKVDFHEFPNVIDTFMGDCVKSQKEPFQNKSQQYFALLDIKKGNEEAQFKILQASRYKQSLHLSLKFKKANDEQVKIYLSQKFDRQRKQNSRLSSLLSQAQHQLNNRIEKLQKLHIEFEQMQKQKNQKIWQLQRRQKQKIKELKLSFEEQSVKKQRDQNQKNIKYINQLNQKIEILKNRNEENLEKFKKTNDKLINVQSSQNNFRLKCSALQQQCELLEKSNKQLKAKDMQQNQKYHNLNNQNTKLTFTILGLEDKLKQKQKRLNQNNEVKTNNHSQISALQQNLRQEKQKIAKLEEKNQLYEQEISKMQKKYEDLFNKYQKKKDKFSDYKEILTLQQQKIQSHEKEQKKMLSEIDQLTRQRQKAERELKNRQLKLDELKSHIEQNQQHIEDQKKIISDLNKRLNQKSIGVKSYGIPSTLPTYTGVYNSNIGREFSSTLSSTSQSRIKYSPSPISTTPLNEKISERIAPPFRKYRQGIENDKDQQNSHSYHSHSRSPIANKLNQQPDPQQGDKTKQKIGPIKFKK